MGRAPPQCWIIYKPQESHMFLRADMWGSYCLSISAQLKRIEMCILYGWYKWKKQRFDLVHLLMDKKQTTSPKCHKMFALFSTSLRSIAPCYVLTLTPGGPSRPGVPGPPGRPCGRKQTTESIRVYSGSLSVVPHILQQCSGSSSTILAQTNTGARTHSYLSLTNAFSYTVTQQCSGSSASF